MGSKDPDEQKIARKALVAGAATLFLILFGGIGCFLFAIRRDTVGIVAISAGLMVWSLALAWNAHSR